MGTIFDDIAEDREVSGSNNATVLHHSIQKHVPGHLSAVNFIRDNQSNECNFLLVDFCDSLTKLAGEIFLKRASELTSSELTFLTRVEALKKPLVKRWKKLHSIILLHPDKVLTDNQFGYLALYLLNCLYFAWCRLLAGDEMVEIEIPDDDLVAKYSRKMVYYVSGWTLQRTSLALNAPTEDRTKYYQFTMQHSITKKEASEASLPFQLVELRQKKKLFYASKRYFQFICLVESIYVKNLTLRMMMAYVDGDLVKVINDTIKSSEITRSKFFALFREGVDESDRLEVMSYVLERYLHMRGCWFVKYLKTSTDKTLGEMRAENAPTRSKVAHTYLVTKTFSKASNCEESKEKALWKAAEGNVLDMVDNEKEN